MKSRSNRLLAGAVVRAAAGIAGCLLAQPISAADTVTYKEVVLHTFTGGTDGASPQTSLMNLNGTLYGVTSAGGGTGCGGQGCGTVFSVDPNGGAETVLYSFCSRKNCADGAQPLVDLIAVNGVLYGTTDAGGGGTNCPFSSGCGTVFSFDLRTGIEKVLYSFCSQLGCTDGESPSADLLYVKGRLYGATLEGGSNCLSDAPGCGTVFSLDPNTGTETVVYSFCPDNYPCPDGWYPFGAPINVKGTLYGTTQLGGNSTYCSSDGCGTVFALDPKTGVETVVHSFCYNESDNCTDGFYPGAAPIAVNGTFYGTTYGGTGAVFSLNPDTGSEAVLYTFCSKGSCADGAGPAGLIAVKGALYGTTVAGGNAGCIYNAGCGTAFSLNPNTGAETVLHSFCAKTNCTDGAEPTAGLIAVRDDLYGVTARGGGTGCGGNGCGTVFVLREKH